MSNQHALHQRFLKMQQQFKWNMDAPAHSQALSTNINVLNRQQSNSNSKPLKAAAASSSHSNSNSNSKPDPNRAVCEHCDCSISLFLIDNHRRHCARQPPPTPSLDDSKECLRADLSDVPPAVDHADSASPFARRAPLAAIPATPELQACRYCEFECAVGGLAEHEYMCGARTDLCDECHERDTLKNLIGGRHRCPGTLDDGIFDLCSSSDGDDANVSELPMRRRHGRRSNVDGAANAGAHQLNFSNFSNLSMLSVQSDAHHNQNANRRRVGVGMGAVQETPVLVRQERRRLREREAQSERDLEFARDLQRRMEREEQELERQRRLRAQLQPQQGASIREERARLERLLGGRGDGRFGGRRGFAEDEEDSEEYDRDDEMYGDVNVSAMSYNELLERFPMDSHGAKENTIARLPTERFRSVKGRAADDKDNQCCICLERFRDGEEVRRLQCLHIFHTAEIDQWLRQNRECPICRTNVDDHI